MADGGGDGDREQLERAEVFVAESVGTLGEHREQPHDRVSPPQRDADQRGDSPLAGERIGELGRVVTDRRAARAVDVARKRVVQAEALPDAICDEACPGGMHELVAVLHQDRGSVCPRQLLGAFADEVHDALQIELCGDDVALRLDDARQALAGGHPPGASHSAPAVARRRERDGAPGPARPARRHAYSARTRAASHKHRPGGVARPPPLWGHVTRMGARAGARRSRDSACALREWPG